MAVRNLMRHARRTALLASIIVIGMAGLFVADSVFESTNTGLKVSFVGSLTGDASICALTDSPFSLFGSEVPIISAYESIPPIPGFEAISRMAEALENVAYSTRVVAGASQIVISGHSLNVAVLGIDPDTYFDVCDSVRILKGDPAGIAANGIFLSQAIVRDMEGAIGRELAIGEQVTMQIYMGGSFRLRLGRFAGIHGYPGGNAVLDRVVLADPTLVRSLIDYTMGYSLRGAEDRNSGGVNANADAVDGSDLSDLFSSNSDIVSDSSNGISLEDVAARMADTSARDTQMVADDAAWSFVLFKATPGRAASLARDLGKLKRKNGWEVRIQDWRGTAGSAATVPYAVQVLFFIGLGFIMLGAVLVVMNALVVSIMERISEIGTMRGIGASSGFIRILFISESMLLTVGSSLVGILIGVLAVLAVRAMGIRIGNSVLLSLMGGGDIAPTVRFVNIARLTAISIAVGALSWIYPVALALRIQPAGAMGKGR